MPASRASASTTDCPLRHGKPDRRNERICHRPTTTGSRESATPATHTPNNRFASESLDSRGAPAVAPAPLPTFGSDALTSTPIATGTIGARLFTSTGTPTHSGGMSAAAIGSSNATPKVAASKACRTAARLPRASQAAMRPKAATQPESCRLQARFHGPWALSRLLPFFANPIDFILECVEVIVSPRGVGHQSRHHLAQRTAEECLQILL